MDLDFLDRLRIVGTIEAISTLVLFFIAMPLKYAGGIPMAVTVAGTIHGTLFVVLSIMFALAIERVPIGKRLGIAGIIAAVLPFGPFVIDRWLGALAERGEPRQADLSR